MRFSHIAVLVLAIGGCSSGRGGEGVTGTQTGPGSTSTSQSGGVDGGGSNGGGGDGGGGGGSSVDGGNSVYNTGPCDTSVIGQNTAAALTAAIGLCDTQYVTGMKFNGPSVAEGRTTVGALGVVKTLEGSAMAYLSNGDAVKNATSSSYQTDEGTDQSNNGATNTTYASPYSTLAAPPNGCGNNAPAPEGNDYEELEIDLTIPPGVNSFSFQFQFFSAEYPTFVCSQYDDRFLAVVEDGTNAQQVAFDSQNNPVTVDSGFFTICTNGGLDSNFQTLNGCTTPVSAISGTGFGNDDNGGSTGWLTTTVPATPGDSVKLRFIIYDEGDHVLDSSVLIDNFKWLGGTATAPTTIQ